MEGGGGREKRVTLEVTGARREEKRVNRKRKIGKGDQGIRLRWWLYK